MERITGPFGGHFIASHACDAAEGGQDGGRFLGYAKICRRRPGSYWDASCLVKICGQRMHADAKDALAEVEALARGHLAQLAGATEPLAA